MGYLNLDYKQKTRWRFKVIWLLYNFGMSVGSGSIVDFLLLALWCLVPVTVVYLILSRSFIRIITTKKGHAKVIRKISQ